MKQTYVLRLWRGPATGKVRITLKEVTQGNTCHFVSLEALLAYLENEPNLPRKNSHQRS